MSEPQPVPRDCFTWEKRPRVPCQECCECGNRMKAKGTHRTSAGFLSRLQKKNTADRAAQTADNYSHGSGGWWSGIKVPPVWLLMRPCPTVSSHGGEGALLSSFSHKGTSPPRGPTLRTSPDSHHVGAFEFGRHRHRQSTAGGIHTSEAELGCSSCILSEF